MASQGIAERVRVAIEETVTEKGCSIWDVEYVKEGSRKVLRITIDSPDGIDLDKCEEVHRAVDPIIDALDPIDEFYYLECSSPGLERTLRKPEHFLYAVGKKVDIKLFTPVCGIKEISGILDSVSCERDSVTVDGTVIMLKNISRANLHFDFEDFN